MNLRVCLLAGGILLLGMPAYAGLSKVSVGANFATPVSDYYVALKQSVGAHADVHFDQLLLPQPFEWKVSSTYNRFSLKNQSGKALNFIGVYGGVNVPAPTSVLGIGLFTSFQLGGVYDWLSLTNSGTQNSATLFAVRVEQGLDVPIWHGLGAVVSMPIHFFLGKNSFTMLNGSFALRWKL